MIAYRQATPSDTPQILSLLEEIMRLHGVAPPDARPLTATVTAILATDDHLLLVAQEHGRLIGMCALIFSLSTWSASLVCELQDVVVTQAYRSSGVGRDLIQSAEEIARARGCSRLFLSAESWNLDAQAFYRKLGLAEKTYLYFEQDLRRDLS
jgi:ribosomal protein S18 acetylase RimI-like enzyme